MEDNNLIDDHLTEDEVVASVRPRFLTVLCVLSFIGSGISVIAYAYTIIFFLTVSSEIIYTSEISKEAQSNFFTGSFVAGIINNILCFVGVIKMWRLQKTGYYLYICSTVVIIVIRIVQSGGGVLSAAGIAGIACSVLFAILYSLNFKHLK